MKSSKWKNTLANLRWLIFKFAKNDVKNKKKRIFVEVIISSAFCDHICEKLFQNSDLNFEVLKLFPEFCLSCGLYAGWSTKPNK